MTLWRLVLNRWMLLILHCVSVIAMHHSSTVLSANTPNLSLAFVLIQVDCTLEVTLQTPSVCTPIHGFMTAQLAPVESSKRQRYLGKQYRESTPEQYLLSTVESYMVNNQSAYLTDELLHVAYIGERDLKIGNIDPEVLARPIANSADAEEAYPGSKYVGISVAGIFIAVLLVGLIYSYREDRQKRKAEEVEMDMEDDDVEVVDVEESKDVLEECDGAFPVMDNMNSMVASDGGSVQESPAKLLLNESSMSNESSIPPPLDPNVPTDNLFGLKGKISSDASMVQSKEDSDDGSAGIDVFDVPQNDDDESTESQPMESMSIVEDPRDEDSVESSTNSEDVDSASQESDDTPNVANDPNWAGMVNNEPSDAETTPLDVNLSPSEATEKMSNTAPFIVENGSSDIEDGLEGEEEVNDEDNGPDGVPSLV